MMVTMDATSKRMSSKVNSQQPSSPVTTVKLGQGLAFHIQRQVNNEKNEKNNDKPSANPMSPGAGTGSVVMPSQAAATAAGNNPPSPGVSTTTQGWSTAAEKKLREYVLFLLELGRAHCVAGIGLVVMPTLWCDELWVFRSRSFCVGK